LKILFIVHGYKPAYRIGGPILSVSALAEHLVHKGHTVTVFTTNSNQSEDLDVPTDCPQYVEGVEVWYFKRHEIFGSFFSFIPYFSKSIGYLYAPALAPKLGEMISGMDLIHTHLPFVYPTFAAGRAAKKYKIPLFYHQRGVFDPARLNFRSFKKRLYLNIIEKPILRTATTLIALSPYEVESYRALCPPNKTIRVIPNGIDVEQYRIEATESNLLNIGSDVPMILFLGRLHPIKGADKLVEAFLEVSKKIPDAVLVMAGPDEFMIENKFKQLAKEKCLSDRIIFPGMVRGEFKKDLLARANLFCLPSAAEGFSMAILEALASGTAVMISPGCHFSEVENVSAGKIVPANPMEMAKVMVKMLSDRIALKNMGLNGRELVKTNYSWESITNKMIEAYEEGIKKHKLKL